MNWNNSIFTGFGLDTALHSHLFKINICFFNRQHFTDSETCI